MEFKYYVAHLRQEGIQELQMALVGNHACQEVVLNAEGSMQLVRSLPLPQGLWAPTSWR